MDTDQTRNDRIAARAHAMWEAAGQPHGEADHYWFEAEREIAAEDEVESYDRPADAQADAPAPKAPRKRASKAAPKS